MAAASARKGAIPVAALVDASPAVQQRLSELTVLDCRLGMASLLALRVAARSHEFLVVEQSGKPSPRLLAT